jgi:hypothetical protein
MNFSLSLQSDKDNFHTNLGSDIIVSKKNHSGEDVTSDEVIFSSVNVISVDDILTQPNKSTNLQNGRHLSNQTHKI